MRKSLLFALALAMLLSCFTVGYAKEYTVVSEGSTLTYEVKTDAKTKEKYAVITAATGAADLVIPGEVDGIPVRTVGKEGKALISGREERDVVETLTVGEGITEISPNAFAFLRSLKKADFPDTLKKIGLYAFQGCYVLSEIRWPEQFGISGLSLGAFMSTGMKDIVLPDGTSVIQRAWDLGMEGTVAYLSTYADGWDYVMLRDGTGSVAAWHDYAKQDGDLTVTVPGQLGDVQITRIGAVIFGALFDQTRNRIHKVVLPDGLKEIGKRAFLRCESLEEINLPESLEKIEFAALAGIKAEGLRLPENAREKSDPLWYCTTVRKDASGDFEYGILSDGTAAITGITTGEKKQITIPAELDGVAVSMIAQISQPGTSRNGKGYEELKKATVSEGIEIIGTEAFRDYKALSGVHLPKSLKRIGTSAFRDCDALTSVKLPEGLEEIGDAAFQGAGLKSVQIPESVVRTGTAPFDGNPLAKATLPKSWTTVPDSLFEGSRLKSISLPKGITHIGKNAFAECRSLTGVTLPEGLVSIGENAFGQNGKFVQALYAQSGGKKAYSSLKSLKLPASLQTIGKQAFAGCDALTKITFAKNAQLREIGQHAFAMCVRLKEISLPDSLEKLGESAFVNCLALKKADLGKGVTAAGAEAFLHDGEMTSLTAPDTLTEIGDDLIGDHHEKLVVTCGQGSAMENWLQAHFPEVTIAYPKK